MGFSLALVRGELLQAIHIIDERDTFLGGGIQSAAIHGALEQTRLCQMLDVLVNDHEVQVGVIYDVGFFRSVETDFQNVRGDFIVTAFTTHIRSFLLIFEK
jgi:hypothetical protein